MCTVTFIAHGSGYRLGMNRDEQRTRVEGVPPTRRLLNGRTVVFPSEPGGGTWIALNDRGATLALINWYSATERVGQNPVSRGEVIPSVCAADSPEAVHAGLKQLALRRINAFRLIGVFPSSGELVEWRWNLKRLVRRQAHWQSQQWISSGFDEPRAQRIRGRVFQDALGRASTSRLDWLRRLHSSHLPEIGPFSTCMHRADAATVSYTEIRVSAHAATMHYHPGPPCTAAAHSRERLQLVGVGRG